MAEDCYLPGNPAADYREFQAAKLVPAGSDITLNLHYTPNGIAGIWPIAKKKVLFYLGTLSANLWDLPPLRQNVLTGRFPPPRHSER